MATQFAPSIPTKRLSAAILSTDSSFILNNVLSWKGLQDGTTTLVAADFPTTGRGVFRNTSNTQIEFFTFDPSTIATGILTILARGLDYRGGTSDGASTAAKYNWPANTTLVELGSNPPAEEEDYVDKLTDETIAGIKTFSSPPVSATNPTASTQVANKAYVDSLSLGGATYDQEVIAGTAGETLTAGLAVYFKTADQRWWKADQGAAGTSVGVLLGFAQGSATAGNAVNVLLTGLEKNQSSLTPGSVYYLGTAGAISGSAGVTTEVAMGIAKSATVLHVDLNYKYRPLATEKAAFVGTSGTAPSGSNKFVDSSDVSSSGGSGKIVRLNGTTYPAGDGSALTNISVLKARIFTDFETAARFNADVVNGSNTFGATGLSQTTTASAGSYAREDWGIANHVNFNPFAAGGIFSSIFSFSAIGTTGSYYVGVGAVTVNATGHTFTIAHVGFKVVIAASVATLSATVADGTETASSLGTIAANDVIEVIAQIVSTSSVNFFWRKNGGALSAATNITTHIPTTTEQYVRVSVSNNSTAVTQTVVTSSMCFER